MNKPHAIISLHPGPLNAGSCTLVLMAGTGELIWASRMPIPTLGADSGPELNAGMCRAAQASADIMLSEAGLERDGERAYPYYRNAHAVVRQRVS